MLSTPLSITRLDTPQGRRYATPAGTLPSVTTILDATMSAEKQEQLRKWRHKLDKTHSGQAATASQSARNRGSQIHALIADSLAGKSITCPDTLTPYWQPVTKLLKLLDNPRACEYPVYHGKLGYAGTLDLVCDWQGVPSIVDWKTSHRPSRAAWCETAVLQLAAYTLAYEWMHGPAIEQAVVVVLSPHRSQVFEFDKRAIANYIRQWRSRLKAYQQSR